jgi:aspartate racemase
MKKVGLLGTRYAMEEDCYQERLREEFGLSKEVINALVAQGAEGIILGCTEIPMLIKEADSSVPLFDTTSIHALKAIDFALS